MYFTSTTDYTYLMNLFVLILVVGGKNSKEGNVYAYNPTTGVDGPVCDDAWDFDDVSQRGSTFFLMYIHKLNT